MTERARRVFLHIGLPKTGTTYLQRILWSGRENLLDQGLLLPGAGHREHLWAALDLQGRKNLARRDSRAPGSWQRLVDEANGHPGDVLITHEFLCAAGRTQATQAREAFPGARVHVVVTARDAAGLLTAGWQESVKNGGTASLAEVSAGVRSGGSEFSWRVWDLRGVLRRWTAGIDPDHVHILPMPARTEPPDQHWVNFAGVVGVDPGAVPLPEGAVNPTLGVVQVELLRRVNAHLRGFRSPLDRGEWIRGYLAERTLSAQSSARVALDPVTHAACRERSRRAIRLIRRRGFHVVGDLSRLAVPDPTGTDRAAADVSAEELLDSAGTLVAAMLADVRAAAQGGGSVPGR